MENSKNENLKTEVTTEVTGMTQEDRTNEEKIEMTQEEFMKKIQSETDKVRTEYSKQIKALKEEIQKSIPKEKSQDEIDMENRIKALEDKEKEIKLKELQLKVSETLENNGLTKQLSKFLNLQGVEDIESYVKEVAEVLTKHINNNSLDNSYKPNAHNSTKNAITKEQFTKMSYMERMNLFKSNEELYNKLSK